MQVSPFLNYFFDIHVLILILFDFSFLKYFYACCHLNVLIISKVRVLRSSSTAPVAQAPKQEVRRAKSSGAPSGSHTAPIVVRVPLGQKTAGQSAGAGSKKAGQPGMTAPKAGFGSSSSR